MSIISFKSFLLFVILLRLCSFVFFHLMLYYLLSGSSIFRLSWMFLGYILRGTNLKKRILHFYQYKNDGCNSMTIWCFCFFGRILPRGLFFSPTISTLWKLNDFRSLEDLCALSFLNFDRLCLFSWLITLIHPTIF